MTAASTAIDKSRLRKLEAAVLRLDVFVQAQALELEALAVGMAQRTDQVYIQNAITATVHRARPSQDGRTICGWHYIGQSFRARRQDSRDAYLMLTALADIPCSLMCERRLASEKALAYGMMEPELSGDEV